MSKSCAKCGKIVYIAEELNCLTKTWHKSCFRCQQCSMALTLKTYKAHNKIPYCSAHCPQLKATSMSNLPEAPCMLTRDSSQVVRSNESSNHKTANDVSEGVEVSPNWTRVLPQLPALLSRQSAGNDSARVQPLLLLRQRRSTALEPLPGFVELSTEPCCVTYDDSEEQRAKMPCGHVIGVEAMKQLCDAVVASGDCDFRCPECDADWEYFVVRHVIQSCVAGRAELEQIDAHVDENYVGNSKKRRCPICSTLIHRRQDDDDGDDDNDSGSSSSSNRIRCIVCTKVNGRPTDYCWRCLQEWTNVDGGDFCGNENCTSYTAKLRTLASCDTKKIYDVDDCPSIRACPRCGTLINHRDGCKHMGCYACHFEFCFVCLQPKVGGSWQCGRYNAVCPVAARQTSIPE